MPPLKPASTVRLLVSTCAWAACMGVAEHIALHPIGLGRYAGAPALYLAPRSPSGADGADGGERGGGERGGGNAFESVAPTLASRPTGVLPVPIPQESVAAFEFALASPSGGSVSPSGGSVSPSGGSAASMNPPLELILASRRFIKRDGGIWDTLPWEWSADP